MDLTVSKRSRLWMLHSIWIFTSPCNVIGKASIACLQARVNASFVALFDCCDVGASTITNEIRPVGSKSMLFLRCSDSSSAPSYEAKVRRHTIAQGCFHPCLKCEFRPILQCSSHLGVSLPRLPHAESVGVREQIVPSDPLELSVDTHQVLVGPFAPGIVGVGYVVCRGQFPWPSLFQKKCEVLGVIVAITSHHVKGHTSEGLGHRFVAKIEPRDRQEQLRVCVRATLPKVEMVHRAKRLYMVLTGLPASGIAIKALGHKVCPAVLLQEPAGRHRNARRVCHE